MAHLPQQLPQDADMQPQGDLGVLDVPHRLLDLPEVLDIAWMCKAFQISRATFYRREKRGVYADFLLLPVYGKKQWNGVKVAAWRRGESRARPIWGRKRA